MIADEEGLKNIEDLQKKMKALQKHQAFEAEIMANKDLIENVGKVLFYILFNNNYIIFLIILFIILLIFQRWEEN